jgi:hypothetical protein
MTVILGFVHKGMDYIAGDALCGAANNAKETVAASKVWQSGEFLIGASGELRFSQVVRYRFVPPRVDKTMNTPLELEYYMVKEFIPALFNIWIEHTF